MLSPTVSQVLRGDWDEESGDSTPKRQPMTKAKSNPQVPNNATGEEQNITKQGDKTDPFLNGQKWGPSLKRQKREAFDI